MIDPDLPLLLRFAKGDRSALGELALRHEAYLLGLAHGILRDRSLAQDAVQDLWVRVIRSAATFQQSSTVKTWLYRILINRCLDLRSTCQPASQCAPEPAIRSDDSLNTEAHARVADAVRKLPDAQQVVILMNYHEHLTADASADILGIPVGTFKSRLHAALTTLRSRLNAQATP